MFGIPELAEFNPPPYVWDVACGVQIVLGLLFCFLGYRLFKLVLAVVGFALGATLAATGVLAVGAEQVWVIMAGVVGGLLGAVLLVLLWFVGIFLLGAGLAVMAVAVPLQAAGVDFPRIALLIIAIVGGIVALFLQKLIIVVSTSFSGSLNLVTGVTYFLFRDSVTPMNMPDQLDRPTLIGMLVAWFLMGITGVVVQYQVTGRQPWRETVKETGE